MKVYVRNGMLIVNKNELGWTISGEDGFIKKYTFYYTKFSIIYDIETKKWKLELIGFDGKVGRVFYADRIVFD